jgi:type VI secretion system secreted protein VgrG
MHVDGSASTTVKKDYTLHVAGSADVVVGTPDKEGLHHALMVHGDHVFGATDEITLRAGKKIVLQCGDSCLEISLDGMKINGKRIDLSGSEGVSMKGAGPSVRLDEEAQIVAKKVRLFSDEASLVLDEDAKLKGKRVLLNCDEEKPTSTTADDKPVETKPFKMKLSDAHFGCYANRTFHMLVDGATYEGTTDGEGVLEKQIPKDAKSLSIVAWTGEYPTSEQRTWTIQLPEMPPATTPRGALMRLANLGYYSGEPKDELDEDAKTAVRAFQAHAGLPCTGALDAATAGKLNAVHGE